MLVQCHLDAGDEFATLLRLPSGRVPVTLGLSPPHAPRALRDGLRGECRATLWLRGSAGTLALEARSLPVDWSADGRDPPDAEDAARFWSELPDWPERLHRLLWLLSDHGLPRSWRTMTLYGRGTFQLEGPPGRTEFWRWLALPVAGTQSLVREEAERLAGLAPDLHARELRVALACGATAAWQLAVQRIDADAAARLPVELLDATGLLPEELVPLRPAGRLVVERLPAEGAIEEAAPQADAGPRPVAPARGSADPFAQPALFWRSQSPDEQRHLAAALQVALLRGAAPAQRAPVVALLGRVDASLARRVADGLGLVPPDAPAASAESGEAALPIGASAALSLLARPGDGRLAGRHVALLAAEGADMDVLRFARDWLTEAGVATRLVGARPGPLGGAESLVVETTLEAHPSVCWDALVLPGGIEALPRLCADGRVLASVREQYRHGKPLLLLGRDLALLRAAGIPLPDDPLGDAGLVFPAPPPEDDPDELPGVLPDAGAPLPLSEDEARALLERFAGALARHRHFGRELDPPLV